MSENKKNPETATVAQGVQELATIREILMGAHIREYSANFQDIDARFAQNAQDTNARFLKLEAEIDQRFIALEKKLDEAIQRLEEKIAATDSGQKQKLSQLFTLLSSQITQ